MRFSVNRACGALIATMLLAAALVPGRAEALEAREGWAVLAAEKSYETLLADLKAAVTGEKMGLVTEAGPTAAVKAKLGVEIPGNRVIGVFRPDFALRTLQASEAAMIEAPIRFYVTEQADGSASLAYKTPSLVFAPYMDEGGEALATIAAELDAIFAAIAARAVE